jgi:hypothetical protein
MPETVSARVMSASKKICGSYRPTWGLRWALGSVALACRGTGISPEIPNTAKLWGDRFES